jgi:Ca2+-transporting ATPase
MILVLLAAAGISAVVGEAHSAYVILAIVVLNALIGFGQEYRAEKAMAALQKMAASQEQVLRGGQPQSVPTASLVPGDVLLLEAGNIIPANVRLLEAHALKVDASSLTGESANVEKDPAAMPAADAPLGDRRNLGYRGTAITAGRATAYVIATGMRTELGKIASLIQTDDCLPAFFTSCLILAPYRGPKWQLRLRCRAWFSGLYNYRSSLAAGIPRACSPLLPRQPSLN